MYTVWMKDEMVCEDVKVFEGTVEECFNYINEYPYADDEFYIVEPDGFTVH